MQLTPTSFGMNGQTYIVSTIDNYKTTLKGQINLRKNEFDAIHQSFFDYLIYLVDAKKNSAFNDLAVLKKISKNSLYPKLEKQFSELLSPIYVLRDANLTLLTPHKIQIYRDSYPLIDFSIDNYNFSVKSSGKKTNTISPSSVVSNNNFKKYIHTLPQTSHFRKYYNIFMILNSSSVMEGPFDLIYGNKTTGGILKELIQKPLNQLLLEKQTNPRDTLVDLETKIENWSKTAPQFNEFVKKFVDYNDLNFVKFSIDKKTGEAKPQIAIHSNSISNSYIRNKNTANRGKDKLGIQIEF